MDDRVGRREKERFEVNVMGTLRIGAGRALQAEITDLSENGCAAHVSSPWMKSQAHVSLRIGTLGPIDATIRWVNDRQIGLEFHRPVYGPVFEHLREMIAGAHSRQDRRGPHRDLSSLAAYEAQNRRTRRI